MIQRHCVLVLWLVTLITVATARTEPGAGEKALWNAVKKFSIGWAVDLLTAAHELAATTVTHQKQSSIYSGFQWPASAVKQPLPSWEANAIWCTAATCSCRGYTHRNDMAVHPAPVYRGPRVQGAWMGIL
jgi:hypothetical protein